MMTDTVLPHKTCTLCEETKPREEFYKNSRSKDGRLARCKTCHCKKSYESRKKRYRHSPSERAEDYRRQTLRRYGLTIEEYDEMVEEQGNLCLICGEPEDARTQTGDVKRLTVDHDHDTGEVRGLLCSTCNMGIGKLNDDPALLRAAIAYLEQGPDDLRLDPQPRRGLRDRPTRLVVRRTVAGAQD